MPEYPDIIVYIERLRPRIEKQPLQRVRLASPFLLRTVDPPLAEVCGQRVHGIQRLGKRIVLEMTEDLFLVSNSRPLEVGSSRFAYFSSQRLIFVDRWE